MCSLSHYPQLFIFFSNKYFEVASVKDTDPQDGVLLDKYKGHSKNSYTFFHKFCFCMYSFLKLDMDIHANVTYKT